jgi:hypothetical protein
MHLRSGKVTAAPVLPWPRPSDVTVTHHETPESLSRDIEDKFAQRNLTLSQRRILFLSVCESLLANSHLACHFQSVVQLAIERLTNERSAITTFNAKAYTTRLRTLEVLFTC